MSSSAVDEALQKKIDAAEKQRSEEFAKIAQRVEQHQSDTLEGKSGVDVLRGILAQRGWDEREGQMQMTQYVDDAHHSEDGVRSSFGVVGIVAPVGTGKTLGYLAPALARGERVVVATSTKALQDQIVGEELPKLREDMLNAYGKFITYNVMKGKGTYPCLSHLGQAIDRDSGKAFGVTDDGLLSNIGGSDELSIMRSINEAVRISFARGDVANYDADLALQKLSADTRKGVTAKHSCPSRKIDLSSNDLSEIAADPSDVWRAAYCQSMQADIVVMYTALLVQEVIKQNNKPSPDTPSILEGVGMVVIDEAHHAPNIVTDAFSARVNRSEAVRLAKDVDKRAESADYESLVRRFFDGLDQADEEIKSVPAFNDAVADLCKGFSDEFARVSEQTGSTRGKSFDTSLADFRDEIAEQIKEIGALAKRKSKRGEKEVHSSNVAIEWNDRDPDDFTLNAVPIDVSFFADRLVSAMKGVGTYSVPSISEDRTVVLCSGTMSASVPRLLGFRREGGVMRSVQTPFDPRRARLATPAHLPSPSGKTRDAWEQEAWEDAEKAIKAAGGRTLFLCTSYRMVEAFAQRMRSLPFTVIKQNDAPRKALIERFNEDENSILIATMGYWEGIDVPGPSLSQVIMDKIPFPLPSDAIMEARREWVKAEGSNAFSIVDIGHASTMLAQGAGRLIRAEKDIGGVLILDPRLANSRYGASALGQMEAGWLRYTDINQYLGWMETVKEACDSGDLDLVLDYKRDAPPLRRKGGLNR